MDKQLEEFFGAAKKLRLSDSEKAAVLSAIQQPLSAAKELSLSAEEKDAAFEAVSSYMKINPIRGKQVESHGIGWWFSFHRFAALSMCVVLLMGMTGGVAYAAEDAMPDDVLYPVKVHFTEPVVEVLHIGKERKARWAARRLERRLAEAEYISKSDVLSQEHVEMLQNRIEKRMAHAKQRMAQVPDDVRAQLEERMQKRFDQHEAFLEKLQSGDVTKEDVKKMKQHVRKVRLKHFQKKREGDTLQRPGPGIQKQRLQRKVDNARIETVPSKTDFRTMPRRRVRPIPKNGGKKQQVRERQTQRR